MRIGRILPGVVLLLLAIQSPGYADSRGKFPGKGSADDYNRTCPMSREAIKCSEKGDYKKAIEIERQAIAIYPYDSALYHDLGYALRSAGQLDEAFKAFRRSIDLEPNYEDSWLVMGECFEQSRKLVEAERCYRKASEIDPSDFIATCNLGDILRQQGKYADAKSILLRAKGLRGNAKFPGRVHKYLKLTELHSMEATSD